MPELGTLTTAEADGSSSPITVAVEGFTPNSSGGGPGKLTIAVNEKLQRVYVMNTAAKRVNVYDGNTLNLLSHFTSSSAGKMFSDDAGERLFIGPDIINPQTGAVISRILQGDAVTAIHPARNRIYVSSGNRLFEYDSTLQSPLRQWSFTRDNLYTSFSTDFVRGKLYVGYFERAVIEIYDIGETTGIKDQNNDITLPREFVLYQNFPNPFNPTTTIRFSLPQREYATLKVFDVLGREVGTLADGEMTTGNHAVTFAPREITTGLYFYKLTAGKFSQTRKAVLMK